MMNDHYHDHIYYHRWDSLDDIDRYDHYLLPDPLTTHHLLDDDHDLTLHLTLRQSLYRHDGIIGDIWSELFDQFPPLHHDTDK